MKAYKYTKKCSICGEEFQTNRANSIYCSEECRAEGKKIYNSAYVREYRKNHPLPTRTRQLNKERCGRYAAGLVWDFWNSQAEMIVGLIEKGASTPAIAAFLHQNYVVSRKSKKNVNRAEGEDEADAELENLLTKKD